MNSPKILLSMDGSMQSIYAANICFDIAKRTGASLTAQHVIDVTGARQFVGQDSPGFLSAAAYGTSVKNVVRELEVLSKELKTAVLSEASQHDLALEFIIDRGDPIEEINKRAHDYDFVVIGHRHQPLMPSDVYHRQYMRLSVAEALSQDLHKPLLVVQKPVDLWKSMTALCTTEWLDADYFDTCLLIAEKLKITPHMTCLVEREEKESAGKTIASFTNNVTLRKTMQIQELDMETVATNSGGYLFKQNVLRSDVDYFKDSLVVTPTRPDGRERQTLLGGPSTSFVRFLPLPAVLLMPQEAYTWKRAKAGKNAASSAVS